MAIAVDIRPEGRDTFVDIFAGQVNACADADLTFVDVQDEQGRAFQPVAEDAVNVTLIAGVGVEGDLTGAVHHEAGIGRRVDGQLGDDALFATEHEIAFAVDVEHFEVVDGNRMAERGDGGVAAEDVGAFDHGDADERGLRALKPGGLVGEGLSASVRRDFDDFEVAVIKDDVPDGGFHGVANRPSRDAVQRDVDRDDIGEAAGSADEVIAGGVVEGVEITIEQGVLLGGCECNSRLAGAKRAFWDDAPGRLPPSLGPFPHKEGREGCIEVV